MPRLKVDERCERARKGTSAEKLARYARDRSPSVRQEVALNPHTPLPVLLELMEDRDRGVRFWALRNPSLPEDLIAHLARGSYEEKLGVAGNPSCPPELLYELAQDEAETIREAVAENPSCPVDLLRRLAEDEYWSVRATVALNPSCPRDLLFQIAKDKDPNVCWFITTRAPCPLELLEELAKDPRLKVRLAAATHPQAPVEWAVSIAREALSSPKWPFILYALGEKLMKHLDELPHDPELWLKMWGNANERGKALIEAHPFGKGVVLLARLGS